MTYSPLNLPAGGDGTYSIPFPYLESSHVRVAKDGETVPFSEGNYVVNNDSTLAWSGGSFQSLTISRVTPYQELYSRFSDGRPTTAEELNTAHRWLLFLSQEIIARLMALASSPDHRNEQADWGEADTESHSFIRNKQIVDNLISQLRQDIMAADAKATATTGLLVQARTLAGIQEALNANAQGTGNTVAHELFGWLRDNYDLALPLPPRGPAVKHVWAGQGEDTFWEEAQFVPTPAESGLVLTSTGTGNTDYRWQEATAGAQTQTINEMIANPSADLRVYNADTLAPVIASRDDLDGDYILVLGILDQLKLTANRLIDAARIVISVTNAQGVRTIVHQESWTLIQDRRVIDFNISSAEETGAGGRIQRTDGRNVYRFVARFMDNLGQTITEIIHHAPLWLEDEIRPPLTGTSSSLFGPVSAIVKAGNNITITRDQATSTLTFSSSGGGGGSLPNLPENNIYVGDPSGTPIATPLAGFFSTTPPIPVSEFPASGSSLMTARGDHIHSIALGDGLEWADGKLTVPSTGDGDPQGMLVASTTFMVDAESVTPNAWVINTDSAAGATTGTNRLSLRISRPSEGARDHTSRAGYLFQLRANLGGSSETVVSEAFYLYGHLGITLGLYAFLGGGLQNGSMSFVVSYGRAGGFVDIAFPPAATVGTPWTNLVTDDTQNYSLSVYEFDIQGRQGPKGEPGESAEFGDRARAVGATAEAGDATQVSRTDHRHDLPLQSSLSFNAAGELGVDTSVVGTNLGFQRVVSTTQTDYDALTTKESDVIYLVEA